MSALARSLPLALLALAACGPAPVCESYVGKQLDSGTTSGTATLTAEGDSATQRFRVTLSGLPELWDTNSPITQASVTASILERYTEGQPGGDGRTQMPRVLISFGDGPPTPGPTAPYFPGASPTVQGAQLFDCASNAEDECCRYGSTGCTVTGTLFVTRTEGEPFPPVSVDWEASASVTVAQCPVASSPELEFVPEDAP